MPRATLFMVETTAGVFEYTYQLPRMWQNSDQGRDDAPAGCDEPKTSCSSGILRHFEGGQKAPEHLVLVNSGQCPICLISLFH